MSDGRREVLDQMYRLLEELDERQGPPRRLSECGARTGWPDAGVYFFYETGELREDGGPRVVRVGTHRLTATSSATLWGRLSQHQGSRDGGGNHRGSIFRLHVGTALLASGDYPEAAGTWGSKKATPEDRDNERRLERAVSAYIGAMAFRYVAADDRFDRATIESGAIALLSNYRRTPIDPASPRWLGHHADRIAVRESHLWNVRHVEDSWSRNWLDVMAACTRAEAVPRAAEPPPTTTYSSREVARGASSRSQREEFAPELWSLIEDNRVVGDIVYTLGQGQPNTVVEVNQAGLVLKTERSASRGSAGEHVPAWMFNRAWEWLITHGSLSRDHLLRDLNVKRSSAVCAVLATLPGVSHTDRPVTLQWDPE